MPLPKFGIGQPVRRKEDDALLRGAGHYVADHAPPGCLHAVALRSPHAHARIRAIDTTKSQKMPGVALVLTGADTHKLGHLPCQGEIPDTKIDVPPYPVLVRDVARHVGDAVAFVVADTVERGRDAAEAIAIDWEPLPAAIGVNAALAKDAPRVWPERRDNVVFDTMLGDAKATARAFASAEHTVLLTVVNQRLVANYLDTRGVVAEPEGDRITLTLSSQGSHMVRDTLCNHGRRIAPDQMRVVTPDVGGGFGTKLFAYREYALAAFAARKLKRPVKWIGERAEHFLADTQGRDNLTTARLALNRDGRFLALDVDAVADMGAYLSAFAPFIPYIGAVMLPGLYDIPVCSIRVRGVYTNTVPVDAYRGAGRPEAAYLIDRLVDAAARETGIAPDGLRRKNFITPSALPYKTATGKVYDSGDFAGHLARAQELAEVRGFDRRHAQSQKAGRLRGLGIASYVEACGNNGPDAAKLRLEADGSVTVLAGSQSTGQGHQTAYAQIIADRLSLPPERVHVTQGDTDVIATGTGTGGSSSIPCGGASVAGAADKLAKNLKELAAEALETAPGDLELADGAVRVAGTDRAIAFAELARRGGAARKLTAQHAFTPPEATYPNGTHIAEVEIDPESGAATILAYVVVDDFGVTLNPLLLAGQVHGGAVQGVGQALMEQTVYDNTSGQLLSASL